MSDEVDDLAESMGAFEAALSAKPTSIVEPRFERVLLALDGSNQDATAEGLVAAWAKRAGAEVFVTASGGAQMSAARTAALSERGARAVDVGGLDGEPFLAILALAKARQVDLIAVCAPFTRDLTVLGQDSLGDTVDLLMSRSEVPLLIIRSPLEEPERCLDNVLLPLSFESEEHPAAAGWALSAVSNGGTLHVLEVADTTVLESAGHLLGNRLDLHALEPDDLERLEQRLHGGLVAALQRATASRNLSCKVQIHAGGAAKVVIEVGNQDLQLIVTSCPHQRTSPNFARVQAILLESRNPVLVV